MKKVLLTVVISAMLLITCLPIYAQNDTISLNNIVDSASYSLGLLIGERFLPKNFYKDLNIELLSKGITDTREGTMLMDTRVANMIIQDYNFRIQELISKNNKLESQVFLEKNKSKEGIKITKSGLQYKIVSTGDGENFPIITDVVRVTYSGRFVNGEEFDVGTDVKFGVSQVVKGWQEGLKLMSIGSKYTFYVPSELAYGEQGTQGIEPNQALIFEVELLDIIKD